VTAKRFFVSTFLLLACAVALNQFWSAGRVVQRAAPPLKVATFELDNRPAKGNLDSAENAFSTTGESKIDGWALHDAGVAGVTLIIDEERRIPMQYGVPRGDVKAAFPNEKDADRSGFFARPMLGSAAVGGHQFEVELALKNGKIAKLGPWMRNLPAPPPWPLPATVRSDALPFHLVISTSNLAAGGAEGVKAAFARYESERIRVAVSVPILYMRTTRGRAGDWEFDTRFDTTRKCSAGIDRRLAEDNLDAAIAYAIREQQPLLFTLNGGVWADAACDVPEWDINDALEAEKNHCQWNERDEVMPDNYLKSLPGSQDAPELARVLSYNIHNEKPRAYKKRNLQAAARTIATFAREHPALFVGVNLDSDTYTNPFFEGKQWYDYNPKTLLQFRQWLQGIGPYAESFRSPTIPNLHALKYPKTTSLEEIGALTGRKINAWTEVDPPRTFTEKPTPFWENAWVGIWEQFKRHLVDVHYDELSQWTYEAGIPREKIFSSQGFHPPRGPINPFPIYLSSPAKNYDSGGMSVQGAVPSHGGLGAVLYGEASRNDVKTENGKDLFSIFNELAPRWAVVESHPGDLREPAVVPTYTQSYASLVSMFRGGAQFVSLMAWNGGSGKFRAQAGYSAFTVIRDTPLETAMKHFLVAHRDMPSRSIAWSFGTLGNSDDEGWKTVVGRGGAEFGQYRVVADANGRALVTHPGALSHSIQSIQGVAFDVTPQATGKLSVRWRASANDATLLSELSLTAGERVVRFAPIALPAGAGALEIAFTGAPNSEFAIHRIALVAK
jgi:hypothetical protein